MKDLMVTLFNVCVDVDKQFDITILSIILNTKERCLFSYGNMGGDLYIDIFFIRLVGETKKI